MLRRPTADLVREYIRKFDDDSNAAAADEAIGLLFKSYPRNEEYTHVLLKAIAINSLYAAKVMAIVSLAKHITKRAIDKRLVNGDPNLVHDIACLELANGKKKRFYSFATKYCHWHNPESYPLYDQYVDWIIRRYNKEYRFGEKFTAEELKHYERLKAIIEKFREHFGLRDFSFKEIDKFLWRYGKEMKVEAVTPHA